MKTQQNPEQELYAKVLRVIVWEQYGILLPKQTLLRVLTNDPYEKNIALAA